MDWTAPKTAQTNGITMEYFEEGEGTPVVLLHGFPEHPFSWREQVPAVVGAGFTGLSAALALGKRGASVTVLDAGRIGGGASP